MNETIIYQKRTKIGWDKQIKAPVWVEIEIKEVDLRKVKIYDRKGKYLHEGRDKQTIKHGRVDRYKTVSISGNCGGNCPGAYAGQIYNELYSDDIDLSITEDQLSELKFIWKTYHLNDLKAGCEHQNAISTNENNWKEKADKETAKCPQGYKYGSEWLIRIIPDDTILSIKKFFEMLNAQG